jgi:hypothetical protein
MQVEASKTIFVERASKSVFLRYVNSLKTSFLPKKQSKNLIHLCLKALINDLIKLQCQQSLELYLK